LELLGKISDVGLFTEKSEVTITHQTTDDIKERLRAKLAKITNPEPDVADAVVLNDDPLDVEAVLSEFDDE
jgi:Fe2+ or Zn2+ uptake regulation protein